ncbi:anti-sigma F factor [Babesia caballi]|uniref:Anti-sigma F factor n=1 Tax=Babesia caballi TaxID=5871 RepID=A0AAV4LWF9_BABCB|nr:anti-sigma F factor [Babesia caballi]
MERYSDATPPPPGRGSRHVSTPRAHFEGRYECWTNEVSSPTADFVHNENKSRYRNVHLAPVVSPDEVDALLCRKPNAVKNFINSLNEQMRQRNSPTARLEDSSAAASPGYESEFGRELQECNVSVKSRITIFDKKCPVSDQGARLKPVRLDTDGFAEFAKPPLAERSLPSEDKTSSSDVVDSPVCLTPRNSTLRDFHVPVGKSDQLCEHGEGVHSASSVGNGFDIGARMGQLSTADICSTAFRQSTERSLTDVVPRRPSFGTGERVFLHRCVSDVALDTARDVLKPQCYSSKSVTHGRVDYVPLRFHLSSDIRSRSPRFGRVPTGCTVTSAYDRSTWTPSVRTSQSFAEAVERRVEIPLELVRRDSALYSDPSETSSCSPEFEEPCFVGPAGSHFITVRASERDVRLHSVNVVKAGWTWMHSARARRWFPKYLVLFYDLPTRRTLCASRVPVSETQASAGGDLLTESSFWGIYRIYSQLGQTPSADHSPAQWLGDATEGVHTGYNCGLSSRSPSNDGSPSPRWNPWDTNCQNASAALSRLQRQPHLGSLDAVTKSIASRLCDEVVLIPDGASVYLTILSGETDDVAGALRRGQFRELMEVDVGLVPYTKKHAPNHWLAGIIARSMGRDPLNLVHIPLVGGYECSFLPLCAAHFTGVTLSYEMERARLKRVGREYEHWLFSLWEFVLRNGGNHGETLTAPESSATPPSSVPALLGRMVRSVMAFLVSLWRERHRFSDFYVSATAPAASESGGATSGSSSEQASLQRVLICGERMEGDVGSPEHQRALTRGFTQWIESRGFDDLSVSMNIYTLNNRFGEC